jgi:hypothetical protein
MRILFGGVMEALMRQKLMGLKVISCSIEVVNGRWTWMTGRICLVQLPDKV